MNQDSIIILSLVLTAGTLIAAVANSAYTFFVSRRLDKIDTLETNLKTATSDLIDQRLNVLRGEINTVSKLHDQQINQIMIRLERGDERFARLEAASHKVEVDLLKTLNDLKDRVSTKDDIGQVREEIETVRGEIKAVRGEINGVRLENTRG